MIAVEVEAQGTNIRPSLPPGRRKMTQWFVAGAILLLASCASAPAPEFVVPVEVADGRLIHLWSVHAERVPEGVKVSGFAARRPTPNRIASEHLHAEAISGDGRVLQFKSVPWNSTASLRARKSASFNTVFELSGSEAIVGVRLTVVAGSVHSEGEVSAPS